MVSNSPHTGASLSETPAKVLSLLSEISPKSLTGLGVLDSSEHSENTTEFKILLADPTLGRLRVEAGHTRPPQDNRHIYTAAIFLLDTEQTLQVLGDHVKKFFDTLEKLQQGYKSFQEARINTYLADLPERIAELLATDRKAIHAFRDIRTGFRAFDITDGEFTTVINQKERKIIGLLPVRDTTATCSLHDTDFSVSVTGEKAREMRTLLLDNFPAKLPVR